MWVCMKTLTATLPIHNPSTVLPYFKNPGIRLLRRGHLNTIATTATIRATIQNYAYHPLESGGQYAI